MKGVYVQKNSPYYWIRYFDKSEEDPKKRRKSVNTKVRVTSSDRKKAEEARKKGERPKLTGTPELRRIIREFQRGLAKWAIENKTGIKLIKDKKLSEGYAEYKSVRSVPSSKKYLKPKRTLFTHMTALLDYDELMSKCTENVEPAYDGMTIEL
jgi:hypothetical protein